MRAAAVAAVLAFVALVGAGCDVEPVWRLRTFDYEVHTVDAAIASRMTPSSWRSGCPVALSDLRYVTLAYHGFDGDDHTGELVLNASAVDDVVGVFRNLFLERFPIETMRLVDDFGGDDDASVAANNTSAFNCRPPTGGSGWSRHAYGLAVDINPLQNPYRYSDGHVMFPEAERFLDRSLDEPGMIHDGGLVVRSFAAIGWGWGGRFTTTKDYQHFSDNGR
ncbi:MAG: M15 family metallopeptidase [Acidimicrobiia bacterium]